MSNVAIDLTKTVKEIITTMKTAIDNLNSDVATNKTAIDNLKTQILEAVYPVGSVYVSITDSRNPTDILGFGTWEALPAGYGLVAQGTATAEDGSTLTFTAGQKSGEFKHQLTVGDIFGCFLPCLRFFLIRDESYLFRRPLPYVLPSICLCELR